MRSLWPGPRRAFAWAIVVVCAVEGALQIGALNKRLRTPSVLGEFREESHRVLCIGDSWTYGLEASTPQHAYPARLQAHLIKGKPEDPWQVHNGGLPGSDSREVLLALPEQLAQYRPAHVCIMVGGNDHWSRPDRVTTQELLSGKSPGSFRLRLPRLLALLVHKAQSNPETLTAVDTIQPTVKVGAVGSPDSDPPTPRPRPNRPADYHRTDPPEVKTVVDRAWQALGKGDAETTCQLLQALLIKHPQSPSARYALVAGLIRISDRTAATLVCREMQQEYDARPEWFLGEFLLKSLAEAGEKQQLLDLAQRCVQQFERSAVCWAYLGWAQYGAGHLEEALAALDRALGLWLNPQQQEEWHGWRARVLLEIDGREVEAAHSLIQIYLARCSAQTLAQRLRTKTVKLRLQHFQAALKDSDCTAKERRVLLQVAAANLDSDAVEETEILKDHLTQMIRLCREAGAQPILSNYATRFPAFHEVAANLSQQLDVPLADHRQRFRRGLQESPKAALFAAGHPTDRGYEFLAQGVAGVILSR